MLDNSNRGSWKSNFGFLMSAIGSAVGLGNIWGFPYKMGRSGGFAFLLVYILLSATVGVTILLAELAMGRKTGKGAFGAYKSLSKKFKWVGFLAVLCPFLIMSFYTVLGGYCMEYMCLNLSNLAFGVTGASSGADLFGSMLTNPLGAVVFTIIFIVFCYLINRGGVSNGIEKFNKVGMPALFFMLLFVIIRSVTLPNASEGLKYMFVPGYAVDAGYIESAPSIISVIATAGGQVFFSLSLAMGIMITYGSYLNKNESLVKNSFIIAGCDTVVALMAGLAVIPAAIATGITNGVPVDEIQLGGPSLLFITLQDVFNSMGSIGPLFGTIFYLLVLIAAITSTISLIEVVSAYFIDRSIEKGKKPKRSKILTGVCIAVLLESILIAFDGLGSNGLWVPLQETFGVIGQFNDCWLDFIDALTEGFAMPLGAFFMSIMIAWVIKPKSLLPEITNGKENVMSKLFTICIKFVVPVVMLLILLGQIDSFFEIGIFK
ncbi:MAG: sodium-dependent transporter [Oscillospiraceae bacterium]|nr:sodium-dependent transporter [Oscillospiraceae bacterium]